MFVLPLAIFRLHAPLRRLLKLLKKKLLKTRPFSNIPKYLLCGELEDLPLKKRYPRQSEILVATNFS